MNSNLQRKPQRASQGPNDTQGSSSPNFRLRNPKRVKSFNLQSSTSIQTPPATSNRKIQPCDRKSATNVKKRLSCERRSSTTDQRLSSCDRRPSNTGRNITSGGKFTSTSQKALTCIRKSSNNNQCVQGRKSRTSIESKLSSDQKLFSISPSLGSRNSSVTNQKSSVRYSKTSFTPSKLIVCDRKKSSVEQKALTSVKKPSTSQVGVEQKDLTLIKEPHKEKNLSTELEINGNACCSLCVTDEKPLTLDTKTNSTENKLPLSIQGESYVKQNGLNRTGLLSSSGPKPITCDKQTACDNQTSGHNLQGLPSSNSILPLTSRKVTWGSNALEANQKLSTCDSNTSTTDICPTCRVNNALAKSVTSGNIWRSSTHLRSVSNTTTTANISLTGNRPTVEDITFALKFQPSCSKHPSVEEKSSNVDRKQPVSEKNSNVDRKQPVSEKNSNVDRKQTVSEKCLNVDRKQTVGEKKSNTNQSSSECKLATSVHGAQSFDRKPSANRRSSIRDRTLCSTDHLLPLSDYKIPTKRRSYTSERRRTSEYSVRPKKQVPRQRCLAVQYAALARASSSKNVEPTFQKTNKSKTSLRPKSARRKRSSNIKPKSQGKRRGRSFGGQGKRAKGRVALTVKKVKKNKPSCRKQLKRRSKEGIAKMSPAPVCPPEALAMATAAAEKAEVAAAVATQAAQAAAAGAAAAMAVCNATGIEPYIPHRRNLGCSNTPRSHRDLIVKMTSGVDGGHYQYQ